MKKIRFKYLALLIATSMITGFTSCDDPGAEEETDNVTVKITNLLNEPNGMGGTVIIYPSKPVQKEGMGDGVATGALMNGKALLAGDPRMGEYFYSGGEGYIVLQTVPRAGIDKYFCYVTKNKATLAKGENTFDFATDFEILHDYGGDKGLLTIEGVPDRYEGSIPLTVLDYSYKIGEDGTFADAIKAKPLALGYEPGQLSSHTADYLALPLAGLTNQRLIDEYWEYEPTGERFSQNGYFFVYIQGGFNSDKPANEEWYHYADQIQFVNGKAIISWSDVQRVIYTSD